MRFLVVTKSKHPMPPEAVEPMFQALQQWAQRHTQSKKMEQVWSFAGIPGGGGIFNVNSLEELDAIMIEFPLGPFSDIEILGLADITAGIQGVIAAAKAMTPNR